MSELEYLSAIRAHWIARTDDGDIVRSSGLFPAIVNSLWAQQRYLFLSISNDDRD